MIVLTLIFWGNFTLFFIVVVPVYIPNSGQEFSFLHILANICCLFLLTAILTMWGSIVVWIGFPWWLLFLGTFFSYIHWPFVCLLRKTVVRVFCSLFNWAIWQILLLSDMSSLYVVDSSPLSDLQFSNIFFFHWLCLHCIHHFFCCVGF